MKTLDEVIKVMDHVEFCCTNCKLQFDCDETECILEDALHYLKAYRDDRDDLTALRAYWAEQQANPPLAWDELKAMEGKPVWVEYNFQIGDKEFRDKSKRWCIIGEFKPWEDTEITITENGFVLSKREQIKAWQAYRKEKE